MKSKPIEGIKSTENPGMKYSSYLDEKDFNEMILDGRTEEEYLEDYCKLIDQALQRGLKRGKSNFIQRNIIFYLGVCQVKMRTIITYFFLL